MTVAVSTLSVWRVNKAVVLTDSGLAGRLLPKAVAYYACQWPVFDYKLGRSPSVCKPTSKKHTCCYRVQPGSVHSVREASCQSYQTAALVTTSCSGCSWHHQLASCSRCS